MEQVVMFGFPFHLFLLVPHRMPDIPGSNPMWVNLAAIWSQLITYYLLVVCLHQWRHSWHLGLVVCVCVCVCVADWEGRTTEEGSRVCLSILKVSLRKGLFLIVSGGCVCFVFADLPECMQMVPGITGSSRAHISLFGCFFSPLCLSL